MREVEVQILNELAESKKTFWELLDKNHNTLKIFLQSLNNFYESGLVAADKEGLYLTNKGLKEVNRKSLDFKGEICSECEGKRILPAGKFKETLTRFNEIVKERPLPTLDFFQGYMREYDVIARVALMHFYGDLADKDFILVGDDDLLSVALSLTDLPSRILVLDVDERLGKFLRKINKEYGFDIEFQKYNVSDPLPSNLTGNFDVFSSEPLETLSGLKAFICRGIACLREDGVGYFGLTNVEASYKKWIEIEKMLTEMNCVITDIIRDFSKYPLNYETINYEKFASKLKFPVRKNPGILWYKSSLFRFKILGKAKLAVAADEKLQITWVDKEEDLTYPLFY